MHAHHTDMFNGSTHGATDRHLFVDGVGANTPRTAGYSTEFARHAADERADAEAAKVLEPVKAAIKDGTISDAEKGVFENGRNKAPLAAEQARLGTKVGNDITRTKYLRDEQGQLILNGDRKPTDVTYEYGMGQEYDEQGNIKLPVRSEHLDRVDELKKRPKLETFQDSIKKLKDAGVESGVNELEAQQASRVAEEAKVVAVVKDKLALVGALEAEKISLDSSLPDTAQNDYQKLREQAIPAIRQFLENDGQELSGNSGNPFGDSWNNLNEGDVAKYKENPGLYFDRMVQLLHGKKEVSEWAAHQGDGNDARSDEDLKRQIGEIARDNPEFAAKIAARYEATQQLQAIMLQYESDRAQVEGASSRIELIDAELGILKQSIEFDRDGLSAVTDAALDAELAVIAADGTPVEGGGPGSETPSGTPTGPTTGPGGPDTDPPTPTRLPPSNTPSIPTLPGDPTHDTTGPDADPPSPPHLPPSDPTHDTTGPDTYPPNPPYLPPIAGGEGELGDGTGGGSGGGVGGPANPDGRPDSDNTDNGVPPGDQGGAGADAVAPQKVKIDYNTAEGRRIVLKAAQKAGYLPDNHVKFDKQGRAVVEVTRQNGARGYWGIAEATAGPDGVSNKEWRQLWNSNAKRLGRDGDQAANIYAGDKLIIPNRSIDDLVKLLGLPRARKVEDEE